MRRAVIIFLPVLAGLWLAAAVMIHADPKDAWTEDEDWNGQFRDLERDHAQPLPLQRALRIAEARFRGRLIAARLLPANPAERARGTILVHELRLLTPDRNVLRLRLDAFSGAFLEVAGAGLTAARRTGED